MLSRTYHEIGKAMSLMRPCNRSAIEVLWLEDYLVHTDFGDELIGLRSSFLSGPTTSDTQIACGIELPAVPAVERKLRELLETYSEMDQSVVRHLHCRGLGHRDLHSRSYILGSGKPYRLDIRLAI